MKIDGRCHCGAISFEAEVTPGTVGICHCTDCQTLTGSAYRTTVPAAAASFALRGRPTEYIKTGESGAKRRHAFCPACGTPIYATAMENPVTYSLRIGTIRQRHELGAPVRQIWFRSALDWSNSLASVPKAETQS